MATEKTTEEKKRLLDLIPEHLHEQLFTEMKDVLSEKSKADQEKMVADIEEWSKTNNASKKN